MLVTSRNKISTKCTNTTHKNLFENIKIVVGHWQNNKNTHLKKNQLNTRIIYF